jgi:hypothetical protein
MKFFVVVAVAMMAVVVCQDALPVAPDAEAQRENALWFKKAGDAVGDAVRNGWQKVVDTVAPRSHKAEDGSWETEGEEAAPESEDDASSSGTSLYTTIYNKYKQSIGTGIAIDPRLNSQINSAVAKLRAGNNRLYNLANRAAKAAGLPVELVCGLWFRESSLSDSKYLYFLLFNFAFNLIRIPPN